jgi:trigger factor
MVRVEVAPLDESGAGTSQPYDLVLGQNQAIPDLEERIMTLIPGEQADAEVKFPDDHPDEARRGQSRRVRVTLHDVKRQELPALDDAFAREVGDFEGLDALRGAIRQDMEREATREADTQVRQSLIQQLVEANGVQAPESLVHRLMHVYAEMYQVPREQLETFEQQFHGVAEAQVRRDLVLDAVIETQGLKATEAELDARVTELAAARGVPTGQLYANLQKANRLPELERAISEEKAFAWLLEQSTIDEANS